MSPTVSIIVPIYKVEKYIKRCLMSLIGQTYNHSEIECILVDDCSPDSSVECARRLVEKEYNGGIRFIFISHEENRGLSEARNTGIKNANGKYIMFVDSDDYITNDCVECHMKEVRNHPDVDVVLANFFHDKPGGGLRVKDKKIPNYIHDHSLLFSLYLQDILPMIACNVLIRKDFILKNNLQFGNRLVQEDILWSFHLYRCASSFSFVSDVTYWYCDNEDSIMNRKRNFNPLVSSYCRMLSEVYEYLNPPFYVDTLLFCLRLLFRGIDYASLPDVDGQYVLEMQRIRNKLLFRTLKDGRIVLASAIMMLYKPLRYVMNLRIFRRYYDNWIKVVRLMANTFNYLR